MAQAVSCWRLKAEAPVRAQVGFVLDKVAVAQIFLSVFFGFLCQYHSTVALHAHTYSVG
jgi:hypothetical protein